MRLRVCVRRAPAIASRVGLRQRCFVGAPRRGRLPHYRTAHSPVQLATAKGREDSMMTELRELRAVLATMQQCNLHRRHVHIGPQCAICCNKQRTCSASISDCATPPHHHMAPHPTPPHLPHPTPPWHASGRLRMERRACAAHTGVRARLSREDRPGVEAARHRAATRPAQPGDIPFPALAGTHGYSEVLGGTHERSLPFETCASVLSH